MAKKNKIKEEVLVSVEGEENFIEVVGDTKEVYEEEEGDVI